MLFAFEIRTLVHDRVSASIHDHFKKQSQDIPVRGFLWAGSFYKDAADVTDFRFARGLR